ncbi:MAG: Mrp/NBP35 family ATP-binding protein [Desulfobacterales bacterium]
MFRDNDKSSVAERKAQHAAQSEEIQRQLQQIKNKIIVMSGKGGVGKSSVAAYLSVVLARRGHRIGLMDVDLHGPSIARMLGLHAQVCTCSGKGNILPVNLFSNLAVISIETLTGGQDAATIWRGPLKGAAIRQFIADVEWGPLDYLVIDSPPGTGDEPLTVAQTIPDARALIVTTPQEIALADVRKSINFCRQVNMEILGLVENMSGLVCPHCGGVIDLFKSNGGLATARKENLPLLGCLPLEPEVVQSGDRGHLQELTNSTLAYAQAFAKVVDAIVASTQSNGDDSLRSNWHVEHW